MRFFYSLFILAFLSSCINARQEQELKKVDAYFKQLNALGESTRQNKFKKTAIIDGLQAVNMKLEKLYASKKIMDFAALNFDTFIRWNDFHLAKHWVTLAFQAKDYTPEKIIQWMNSENRTQKWVVIEAMGTSKDNVFVEPLLKSAKNNADDDETMIFILDSLAEINDVNALPFLKACYGHGVWGVRMAAGKALEKMTGNPHPVAMPSLN